jgi:hypothetical protein
MTGTLAETFHQYEPAATREAYPPSLLRIRVSASKSISCFSSAVRSGRISDTGWGVNPGDKMDSGNGRVI